MYGPRNPVSQWAHATKYRSEGESFEEAMTRIARTLADDKEHYDRLLDGLLNQRIIPAGRVQSAVGATRQVTANNCYVMDTIPDSMEGIMRVATEAAFTMRMGGGVGYDFSTLRPRGDLITTLDSNSSGPVSFMEIFDAVCSTISSAGHRRGAQMAVLRVDHPDIEEFVRCKQNGHRFTNFNISVAVTDKFMIAVQSGDKFDLHFDGRIYKTIDARALWEEIMRSNWDWAEPGVLYIDRMNEMNNLWYAEKLAATNPCAEQPLPPYGACLLGSINMTGYLRPSRAMQNGNPEVFMWDSIRYEQDVADLVRALDNVIDGAVYPLDAQRKEQRMKRRMGVGVTGMANTLELLGYPYGSETYIEQQNSLLKTLTNTAYKASSEIAAKKGSFPLFDLEKYLRGKFVRQLDENVRQSILRNGMRNSHLTSIAPTGTISLTADNVSSGIEPVFSYEYERTIRTFDGEKTYKVRDWAFDRYGFKGKTADEVTADEHVSVLNNASQWMDSSVSKTCNVSPNMTWEDFKDIYVKAWQGGSKGCTTFNIGGKRFGVLTKSNERGEGEEEYPEGQACFIDPVTGDKECA